MKIEDVDKSLADAKEIHASQAVAPIALFPAVL
jgi:hypothetical protein